MAQRGGGGGVGVVEGGLRLQACHAMNLERVPELYTPLKAAQELLLH